MGWIDKFFNKDKVQNIISENMTEENITSENIDEILEDFVDYQYCYYSGNYNHYFCDK